MTQEEEIKKLRDENEKLKAENKELKKRVSEYGWEAEARWQTEGWRKVHEMGEL